MKGYKLNAKMNSSINCYKTGGSVKKKPMKKAEGGKVDAKQDKALVKKAFKQHDKNLHGGKSETLKLKDGGKAKKADGGSMMEKKPKAAMSSKPKAKKSMAAPKSKAPKAQQDVAPLGAPTAMEPAMGMTPQPMMSHGGTVRHEHYAMGGGVGDMAGAGMAAGAMGGAGAMVDPRLLAAKKRLAAIGGMGAGAGAAMGAGLGQGLGQAAGAAPQGMPPAAAPGMPR